LRTLCRDVGAHWRSPESLTQLARFETIATTLGNRGAHAGPRDATYRLTRAGRFDPQLGPHAKTAAYSGFALYLTSWSFGCLAYLLARDLGVTTADAWHAFFWPLVKDVTP
jgi:hypothetical protein